MHASILRYLVAVAEARSIRRASERLNISASAVNRQIINLERSFGTPLFERRTGGLHLTDAGRIVVRHCEETLRDFSWIRSRVDQLKGILSGDITITTLDSLTATFLPEALAQFFDRHPNVEIHVLARDPMEVVRSIAAGSADLGLTFDLPKRPGIRVIHEIACPMHAVMSADHELASRESVTLDECGSHPLVFHENSASMRPFLGPGMDEFQSKHKAALTCNNMALMKRFVLRGSGIAFYTRLGFFDDLEKGELATVPLEDERLSQLRLCLITSSERMSTIAARAMADHLKESLVRFGLHFLQTAAQN